MSRRQLALGSIVLVLAVAMLQVTGCTESPDHVADRFTEAAKSGRYVEAVGYLAFYDRGSGGRDEEQAARSLVSSLLPDNSQAGYHIVEQSDSTAKVVMGGDSSRYMLLRKSENKWLITQVLFTKKRAATETIPHETDYVDDPSMWEGDERTTVEGTDGAKEVTIMTAVVNGEAGQEQKTEGRVLRQPAAASVTRGTRPRSAGWRPFPGHVWRMNVVGRSGWKVRVTDVIKRPDGLQVRWEAQPGDLMANDVRIYIATSKVKRGQTQASVVDARTDSVEQGFRNDGDYLAYNQLVSLPNGDSLDKDRLLFVAGSASEDNDGRNKRVEESTAVFLTCDQLYPGPVKEE